MTSGPPVYGEQPAPPIPEQLEWLNTGRPLTMDDFKGRLTILHFWTYA